MVGLQANRAAPVGDHCWRIWPNEPVAALPGLHPGIGISRNRDHAWEQALARSSAERRIEVRARLAETGDGLALSLTDADGVSATASDRLPKAAGAETRPGPRPPCGSRSAASATPILTLVDLELAWSQPWFVPASTANRCAARRWSAWKPRGGPPTSARRADPPPSPPALYPEEALTYLANVYNQAARAFYARHGVQLIEAAYEAHEQPGEVSLMITKHCLRYAFSLCPKQAKGVTGVQGQVRAEPMTLVNGNERLTLRFDCPACEMHVVGRIKRHILNAPPPGQGTGGSP